jgi:L-lactate dehydrogenase complex protein LldE
MKISLFTTCLTDSFFPQAATAVVLLLRKLGCQVDLPPRQTCCGQPQFNNGLHRQARSLARNLIDAFAGSGCVVCPSASCTAMIRDYYPQLFADLPDYRDRAREFIEKTYEFTEFVSKILKADLKALHPRSRGRVTYHYSCHNRGVDLAPGATIDLIKLIDGLEYAPLEKIDQCCGFGGTFAVKMAPVSQALVADKVACIQATAANTVIVNEGGCTLNIAGYCHRQGLNLRFVHIAQLLAESLGLMDQKV